MNKKLRGSISLLTATVIWGFAFIAQSVGMELIGPFTFQMIRCILAVLFLIPCSFVLDLGKATFRESAKKAPSALLFIFSGCPRRKQRLLPNPYLRQGKKSDTAKFVRT